MAKMMTSFAFSCLCHHLGVSGYAGTPRFPAVEAHMVLSLTLDDRPNVPPPPDPGDLAGKYGARTVSQVIPRGSNSVDDGPSAHWAILPWARYCRIDPLGLNQNAQWKDPLLATLVITPG